VIISTLPGSATHSEGRRRDPVSISILDERFDERDPGIWVQ
jgi:hypothetical protein